MTDEKVRGMLEYFEGLYAPDVVVCGLEWRKAVGKIRMLIAESADLLGACEKMHNALDSCLAEKARENDDFMPSESSVWPAVVLGAAVIRRVKNS